MEFSDYEFFCHEMIKEELTRHEVVPDPNPWLEDKIQSGRGRASRIFGRQTRK